MRDTPKMPESLVQDELRKRFDQIEDEVARGKHTAASVFTQMRTAAMYIRPAQTEQQPEQEPFWYAVVSEQAPTINSAIKRLDVAQEFADSKRERWPDTRVVPLYTASQPEQSDAATDMALSPDAQKILTECIGAHAYVVAALVGGRPDLALAEARKWVEAFRKAGQGGDV